MQEGDLLFYIIRLRLNTIMDSNRRLLTHFSVKHNSKYLNVKQI